MTTSLQFCHIYLSITQKLNSHVICDKEKIQDFIIWGCHDFHSLNCELKLAESPSNVCRKWMNTSSYFFSHFIKQGTDIYSHHVTILSDQGIRPSTCIMLMARNHWTADWSKMTLDKKGTQTLAGFSSSPNQLAMSWVVEQSTVLCNTSYHQCKYLHPQITSKIGIILVHMQNKGVIREKSVN